MTGVPDLATLKRRSLAARGTWQLIRIAVLARSARRAFQLAERLGWYIDEAPRLVSLRHGSCRASTRRRPICARSI